MTETTQSPNRGLATASLVLGIISVALAVFWPIAIILGILAIVFGSVALSKIKQGQAGGKGSAKAGIITGSVGIFLALIVLVVTIVALPAAHVDTRDLSRRKDVSDLASQVVAYGNAHDRVLPTASQLDTSELLIVKTVSSEGKPTTTTAVYTAGESCDGLKNARLYNIRVMLESGKEYCL